jgi:anti-anti-sigma factor
MAIQVQDEAGGWGGSGSSELREPALRVELQRARTTALLLLQGELDGATAPLLVDAADVALEEPCETLIVSCEGLTFADSFGLRSLLAVRAACAGQDTRVFLVKRSPLVEHLLELGGMTELFR